MNKIVIITGNDNFFGQARKPWVSSDISIIEKILTQNNFEVETYTYHEALNNPDKIKDSFVFYSFSQRTLLRNYISDLVYYLSSRNNIMIPSFDLLKCHENKGYQELLKKKMGFSSLKSLYLSSITEIDEYQIDYPVVLKSTDGSNARGVYLVHNKEELTKTIKNKLQKRSLSTKLDLLRRKYLRKKKTYKEYPDYCTKKDHEQYSKYILREKPFVLQEFVPHLKFDYRVLVLYDKFFVTKRHTRKDDFRASGAKKFDFNFEPDQGLLDYARKVYDHFDSPYLSIDIVFDGKNYSLIEFQALHFGINVFVKNSRYFIWEENEWNTYSIKNNFETEMANALTKYIRALS